MSALTFIHSKGIAHRDLKLENLLFDENMNLKIADFGLSNIMTDGKSLKTFCGSPDYAAPEILKNAAYDGTKIDAWSTGVILYTMLCGRLPFESTNQSKMFRKIVNGDFKFDEERDCGLSDEVKDLIYKLLDPNPITRFSVKQAQEHPWLSREIDPDSYLSNYGKFLAKEQFRFKPKSVSELDENILHELQQISHRFPM